MQHDVRGVELQLPARVLLGGEIGGHLRVLHHVHLPPARREHAHGLLRIRLRDHLRARLGALLRAESDERRVPGANQRVIHAVRVHVLHAPPSHVGDAPVLPERRVDAAVAVGRGRDRGLGRHDDLAVEGEAREPALFEEDDVGGRQAEVAVGFEVRDGGVVREGRRHDVQRDRRRWGVVGGGFRRGLVRAARAGELRELLEPFRLEAEQAPAARQADVVHPLRVARSEPRALAAREQNDRELALGGGAETQIAPPRRVIRVRRRRVRANGLDRALGAVPGVVVRDRSRERRGDARDVADHAKLVDQGGSLGVVARVPVREDVALAGGDVSGAERRHLGRIGGGGGGYRGCHLEVKTEEQRSRQCRRLAEPARSQ